MRIISLIVALLVLFNIAFVKNAKASNILEIDTNIKNKFQLITNLFGSQAAANEENQVVAEVAEPEEKTQEEQLSEEEIARDQEILSKWKEKQLDKWNNLPQGQFTVNASAYTAAADETGGSGKGITSSGLMVKENRTIACPPNFPFGTKIKIDGYGTYTCEDRGGAIKGNKIDIYMQTKAQAFQFGRRNLIAEVVK